MVRRPVQQREALRLGRHEERRWFHGEELRRWFVRRSRAIREHTGTERSAGGASFFHKLGQEVGRDRIR